VTPGLIFCAKVSPNVNLLAQAEKVNKSNTVFQAFEFSIDIEKYGCFELKIHSSPYSPSKKDQ
jgi:hypothetical protein